MGYFEVQQISSVPFIVFASLSNHFFVPLGDNRGIDVLSALEISLRKVNVVHQATSSPPSLSSPIFLAYPKFCFTSDHARHWKTHPRMKLGKYFCWQIMILSQSALSVH